MENVFSNIVDITFDQDLAAVILTWKDAPTSDELRTNLDKALEVVASNKATGWIGDVRNIGVISAEDQQWSNENWFPRAIGAGIKNMAVLVSDDVLTQMTVDEIMSKVESLGFSSQYFSDLSSARTWLKGYM